MAKTNNDKSNKTKEIKASNQKQTKTKQFSVSRMTKTEDIQAYLYREYLHKEYAALKTKIFHSKAIFIFLSLSSIIMSTIIVIMTMFIIGKKIGGKDIQMIFVSISILTSFSTFIGNLDGIFRFNKRRQVYLKRIEELNAILKNLDEQKSSKQLKKEIIVDTIDKIHEIEDSATGI